MSVKKMGEVWDFAHDLRGSELLVMLAMADWANDDGYCWPKLDAIAAKVRVDRDTAKKIVKRLESAGYLLVEHATGRGHSNRFWVYPRGNAPREKEQKQQAGNTDKKGGNKTPFLKGGKENPLLSSGKGGEIKPPFIDGAYKDEPSVNNHQEPSHTPDAVASGNVPGSRNRFQSSEIEAIYGAYPRKEAKREALSAIARALERIRKGEDRPPRPESWPPPDPVGWLKERSVLYAKAREGENPKYTPHPATWFNQARYSDDEANWNERNKQNATHQRQPEQRTRAERKADAWDAWAGDLAAAQADADRLHEEAARSRQG